MQNIIKFVIKHKFLVIIAIISFTLRFVKLNSLPFNFHEDEVLVGYVGRYILENGFDIYDNKWPLLYFNKFGDFYIIGPMYVSAFSTLLFGVNEFAVRFPAAFLGSLIIFPIYVLSFWTFRNKTIALLSALFVAILPWHIILSRSSVEGVIGSTIFLSGILILLYAVRTNKFKYIVLSSILLFITYWIYHPFRIYTPLVFIPLFFLFPSIKQNRKMLVSVVLSMIFFFGLTYYISTTEWGKGRLMQTSIFSPISGVERRVQEQIFASGEGNVLEARLFNNKLIGYSREFIRQYLSYYSPSFLFSTTTESRYDMPDQGLLYFTYLGLLIAAIFLPNNKLQTDYRLLYYMLFLIVLAPLPSAFTFVGSPNLHRSVLLGIMGVIPAALGMYKLTTLKFGRYITVPIICILLLEFIYFWHQYSVQGEVYNAIRRNDAHRELVKYVQQNKNQYDTIYLPAEGTLALYYLFYSQNFNPDLSKKFKNDARIDHIEHIYFLDVSCPTTVNSLPKGSKILVVDRYQCNKPAGFSEVQTIKGKNHLLGFNLYTN